MSATENLFKGDRSRIAGIDIDAPLASAGKPCCTYYVHRYASAAKEAEQAGNLQAAAVYWFLSILTDFHPKFDTPDEPYGPVFQSETRRSPIPSDLTSEDILVLRALASITQDPALRSRIYDVLWEVAKDHKECGEAVSCYVQAAERLDTGETWIHAADCYHRALYLAGKLGRSKELFGRVSDSLQKAARKSTCDADGFRCCRYLELLARFGCGDPSEFAKIAAEVAKKASDAGNPFRARDYWEVAAKLHGLAKNKEAEDAACLAAAETYATQAEMHAKGGKGGATHAALNFKNAVEALRRAGAPRERIAELRQKLAQYQENSMDEMKTFSANVDLSKAVEAARRRVECANLRDALFQFALSHPLLDPKALGEEVTKLATEHPISHLFSTTLVDSKGRAIAVKKSVLNPGDDEAKGVLEAEMFSHAAQSHWPVRVQAFIEPARLQILNDHHPTFRDLAFLVQDNPFVPPGHEGIFVRGIHAGFHGDFLVASHLLVPQIENSLRHVLESQGVDVSNLKSDGTQPLKVLGPIFGLEETRRIFGEHLCFELRGCLIEKTGYGFRDRLAHGFVSEGECYSPPAKILWWLVLRICLIPIAQSIEDQQENRERQGMTKPESIAS